MSMTNYQKPPAYSPSTMSNMHQFYTPSSMLSAPPYSKEEIAMLRFNEHMKKPALASSPSVSSPESLNSESSIDIGDKMSSFLKHGEVMLSKTQLEQRSASNKDIFPGIPFAGYPLMPGFLPATSHFLFQSYQNALHEQNHHFLRQHIHQDLLKTSAYPEVYRENHKNVEADVDVEDHEEKPFERGFKRKSPSEIEDLVVAKIPKRSRSAQRVKENQDENDNDVEIGESDDVLTPPSTPSSPNIDTFENNPIDLSVKAENNAKPDFGFDNKSKNQSVQDFVLSHFGRTLRDHNGSDDKHQLSDLNAPHATSSERERRIQLDNKLAVVDSSLSRIELVAPLDLTSKV